MVEINNQHGGVPRYAGVVGGTDNPDVRKPEIMDYDVIVGGELFTDYSDHPSQTCHAKPKTQINRRRTLPASSRWWDAYRKQLGLKDTLRKVRTLWHCSRLRAWRFTYDWSWWYPSGNRPLQQYLRLLPGAGYGQFEHKADSLIAKFKEAGGTVQRLMYEQSAMIISALVICIIVCLSWAVNHYRDNAIAYKTQRDARELKRRRGNMTCRCVSVMLLRSMQNTRGVSWC